MRIAYLSVSILPSRTANSIHVMKMCQAFCKNGHSVTLFAPNHLVQEKVDNIHKFYGVEPIFSIKKLFWGEYKGRDYIYGLLCAFHAKRMKVDLIYSRCLLGAIIASTLRIPVIYEIHDDINKVDKRLFFFLLKRKYLQRIIAISSALKKHLVKNYRIPKEKVLVAHDAADDPSSKETIPLSDSYDIHVGYIGHLYRGRGLETIMHIAQKCPWAQFHIIGGMQEDIEYWKHRINTINNIKLYGFIPPSKTEIYRNSFDVLLAPYQRKVLVAGGNNTTNTSKWMSPLKIFEYMASGNPIICSNLPVLCEILTHGKNALLCHPEKSDEWSDSLQRLRCDLDLRSKLSAQAYQDFRKLFTWQVRAQKVLKGN